MSNRNEPDVIGLFILLIIFITVCVTKDNRCMTQQQYLKSLEPVKA